MALFLRNLKRCIPLALVLVLLINLLPAVPVSAAEVLYSGTCGDSATWKLYDDGLLLISGSGSTADYAGLYNVPWSSYKSSVTSIRVEGISHIGTYVFSGLNRATSLFLDESVTSIGNYAFKGCYGLTVVDIPSSVASIGTEAFYMGSDGKIMSIILNGSSSVKSLPDVDFVFSSHPYCIFVDPGLLDEYREAYPKYSYRFCEFQCDWSDNVVPVTDYMASSSSTSSATVTQYAISDAWYLDSGTSSYCSLLPYNLLRSDSTWTSLSPNDKVFSFGSLKDVSYFDLTVTCTYTASGTASYNGSRSLYLYFYDAAGELISSTRYDYVSGSKLLSGTQTVSCTTDSITVPENAAYFGAFMDVNGFSGLTVSSKRFDVDLTLTSALIVPPVEPSISSSILGDYEYDAGDTASPLSVSASVTDGGTLSYQWYQNISNSTVGGTAISGATSATYTPSTASGGTKYYYCKVINSLDGLQTSVFSDIASVSVNVPAQTPSFGVDLSDSYTFTQDEVASPLSVSASVTDGGKLTYQWYENTRNSISGGTAIPGATGTSYTPSTDTLGTKYYYCIVKNTLGSLTATACSNVAAVEVAEPTYFISGQYVFETDLSNCYPFYLDISGGTRDGSVEFTSVKFDIHSLVFDLSQGGPVTAWTLEDGWIHEQFKIIYFDGEELIPASVYGSFLSAAYSTMDAYGDAPYLTTISIDGVEYHFFDYLAWTDAYPSSPDVSVFITSFGVVMKYGIVTKSWSYTGDGEFAGLSLSVDGSDPFPIGTSGTLPGTTGADSTYDTYVVETKCATFVIGDQTYVFPGTLSSTPEITMDVLAGGVRLSDGTTSYFYEHDSTVLGYKLSPDADTYIGIGESYIFAGSDAYSQTLYPIYATDVEFYTTINIYDSTGTKLLGSYDFFTLGASPAVSLTVLGNGCKLVFGDTSYSWYYDFGSFYGLSPAMYVAAPYYAPGNVYTLPGGDAVNLVIDLYVHDTESSGLPALDFVDWLKSAVGGFLDFEIFPSLSLDEILYFILVVRLLLWFLKVAT